MIKTMRAKTQHEEEKEKTWTKENTLEQKAKRNAQEVALTESRALP